MRVTDNAHFTGKVEGRVTWNRTKLESFQAEVATTTSTPTEQDCPGGYSLVGDKCLLFVTFVAEPYGEARQFCHAAKGELAAITTATDFKNTVDYIHANGGKYTSVRTFSIIQWVQILQYSRSLRC